MLACLVRTLSLDIVCIADTTGMHWKLIGYDVACIQLDCFKFMNLEFAKGQFSWCTMFISLLICYYVIILVNAMLHLKLLLK